MPRGYALVGVVPRQPQRQCEQSAHGEHFAHTYWLLPVPPTRSASPRGPWLPGVTTRTPAIMSE
jgi:hypothetical protein